MLSQPSEIASLKNRDYFIFHKRGLPTIHDAVTGPNGKLFPAGQVVDVIGHHIPSGTSLVRIRDTQYHSWLETKCLQLYELASTQ